VPGPDAPVRTIGARRTPEAVLCTAGAAACSVRHIFFSPACTSPDWKPRPTARLSRERQARLLPGEDRGWSLATVSVPPRVRVETINGREAWNAAALGFADCTLEQGWEWGEVLRTSGAQPHRCVIVEEDHCVAATTIISWRVPGTSLSLLYASRGPLVQPASDVGWLALMRAIRDLAAPTNAILLRVSPAWPSHRHDVHEQLIRHGFTRIPDEWTIWNAPRIVMTLTLDGTEREVWARLSNSRRREIRAAEQAGITVEPAGAESGVEVFYRLVVGNGRRKRYPVRRAAHFEALARLYGSAGTRVFLLAKHHGEVVGGLVGAKFGHRAYLLYSGVDRGWAPARTGARPGPLLYWRFIRWAQASGCAAIHWGGSGTKLPPGERDPGYGVYQFKRSFGSSCFAYLGYYDLVFRPALYKAFRIAERQLGPLVWRLRARLNR
jgi:peptidoglycan pentaglycine glycine transferase (the first glycine)